MSAPRELTDDGAREMARRIRDNQWKTLEQIAEYNPLYICWWNKDRYHDWEEGPDDLKVCGLIDGMELVAWLKSHPDWTVVGEWSDERHAAPVSITDAGRHALANREIYDSEPVVGGLVEPGWQAVPSEMEEQ